MALYEYRCTLCGDQIVSHSNEDAGLGHTLFESDYVYDDPSEEDLCPGPLKRVWSVGFTIKSTDWSH